MNTETTEYAKGWLFYDADCPICAAWAGRVHDILLRYRIHVIPLQSDWAKARLGSDAAAPLTEMKLLLRDGRIFGGGDALVQLARAIWWAWPFFLLAQFPGAKRLLRFTYGHLAARRYCFNRQCTLPNRHAKTSARKAISFFDMP